MMRYINVIDGGNPYIFALYQADLCQKETPMRKVFISTLLFFTMFAAPAMAGGGLDGFLRNLNIEVRADIDKFSAKVCIRFGVPEPQVRQHKNH
jgi:hypothetical protein